MIGITPTKSGFVVLRDGECEFSPTKVDIKYINDEYIKERNNSCKRVILIALGLIPGYEDHRIW